MTNSTAQKTSSVTIEELQQTITELTVRIVALEQASETKSNKSQREMTDTDAYKVLNGELKDLNHNKAAEALKLSYGQIYSCRLQYTFRHIHKELETKGFKNPWKK
jgi:predicted  nucleic acid-binding Zn-ribbon protein